LTHIEWDDPLRYLEEIGVQYHWRYQSFVEPVPRPVRVDVRDREDFVGGIGGGMGDRADQSVVDLGLWWTFGFIIDRIRNPARVTSEGQSEKEGKGRERSAK